MGKQTKIQDKRAQLFKLIEMENTELRYGDTSIVPAPKRSMRQVKSKRKKIKRQLASETRPESRFSIWIKMTFSSSFLILALFAIPVAVGLLIMLATIPQVIRELNLIPSTIAMVTAISMGLLFVQSGLISAIVVYGIRLRSLRIGTIITVFISLVSISVFLGFLASIFQYRIFY